MTWEELTAAQWRALHNMASGYGPLVGPETVTSLATAGLIERDGAHWRMTRDGHAAYIMDRRTA